MKRLLLRAMAIVAAISLLLVLSKLGCPKRDEKRLLTTPLVDAASSGDTATMKTLIAGGAEVNEKSAGFFHWTPLIAAIHERETNAVDFLLRMGADVNVQDTNGRTPLIWAVDSGGDLNLELVKKLIAKGADVNARDKHGVTALGYAVSRQNTPTSNIVSFLKQAGATK